MYGSTHGWHGCGPEDYNWTCDREFKWIVLWMTSVLNKRLQWDDPGVSYLKGWFIEVYLKG